MTEVLRNVDSRNQDEASRERHRPKERHERLVEHTLCDFLAPEWEEEFTRGSVHCVWLNSAWGRTTPPCVQTPLSEDSVPRKRPVAVMKVVMKKRCKKDHADSRGERREANHQGTHNIRDCASKEEGERKKDSKWRSDLNSCEKKLMV